MGLHIDIVGLEKLPRPLAGQIFHLIDEFAPPVIAFSGIAFGVFVGQHAGLGFPDRPADKIFRGDQFQALGSAVSISPRMARAISGSTCRSVGPFLCLTCPTSNPPPVSESFSGDGPFQRACSKKSPRFPGPIPNRSSAHPGPGYWHRYGPGPSGRKKVIADRRPHPGKAVGGDSHPDPGPADQNPPGDPPLGNSLGHLSGQIRVVHRLGPKGPYILPGDSPGF